MSVRLPTPFSLTSTHYHQIFSVFVATVVGGLMWVDGHSNGYRKGYEERRLMNPTGAVVQKACAGEYEGLVGPDYYRLACQGLTIPNPFKDN